MRLASLLLLVAATLGASVCASTQHQPHRLLARRATPAPRDYDNFYYYVLELDEDVQQSSLSLERVASSLGAQHVEQVGELAHHFLLRAPKTVVERGDLEQDVELDMPTSTTGAMGKRAVQDRDLVTERYARLRRSLEAPASLLSRRSNGDDALVARALRSLERQTPRQRVKRDLPVEPPVDFELFQRGSAADWATGLDEARAREVKRQGDDLIALTAEHFGIEDPLFPKQWHLFNGQMRDNDVNMSSVWDDGIFGKGVNVAIVDDGLDMDSEDLAPNFHAEGSWDFNDHNPLPRPRLSDDQHGTRCAGEIAAAKNSVCGLGVAYEAGVAGIRILSGSITDADEAASLNFGFQTNDIYSCSWGPPDDGKSMDAPGRLIRKAMLNGVQNGRGGLGNIFVFASGNGGAMGDQCNFDGYTNSLLSITVGAIDRKGLHPYYSEACAANMVVTYSSGSGDNIHTTDVGKAVCTDRHGGTSAAAPLAAGIFALVLEARPELTWRDLQHLCVQNAVQIHADDDDWQMTPSGRYFNHKYGWGKLDAARMVKAARSFELVKPQAWWESQFSVSEHPLTAEGTTATIDVSREQLDAANFEQLEHITVTVFISHQRRGNVEVELHSPSGMVSILARARRFDEANTGFPGWVFMTVKHWDEDPVGTWTLVVSDKQDNGKTGTFHKWSMHLWGSSIDAGKATPYKLPDDAMIRLPPQPTDTATTTTSHSATRSIVRPTAHLPDDHSDASATRSQTTEAAATTTEEPTPSASPGVDDTVEDDDAYVPGYMAGMGSLVRSSTWVYVSIGLIVIFAGGLSAFFCMRTRARRERARERGYDFAPMDDEDDVPMGAMERGRVRLPQGSGRTKDLYDAFAIQDSDDDLSDGDERERPLLRDRLGDNESAMGSFHDDQEAGPAPGGSRSRSQLQLPLVDDGEGSLVDVPPPERRDQH